MVSQLSQASQVVVGADVHKHSHTFVAVDETGKKLGQLTVRADSTGHDKAVRWAQAQFGAAGDSGDGCGDGCGAGIRWGIEDCRHLSARLEIDLLEAGQHVVRVPPKLMAEQRRTARTRGKSDPIDALAVARAVLREPDLPVAAHDEASRELKLLVDHRDDLVAQRTQVVNRFRWHLHRIDPTVDPAPASLNRAKTRRCMAELLADRSGIDARLARELLTDIETLTARVNTLKTEIAALVAVQAPALLELEGCGTLTAAKIVGETAGITRFPHEAKYAMHAGVAPIPVWSGRTAGRVRVNRSGNRQLNAALHRIAVTQIRLGGLGKAYYDKRLAAGDSTTEALRCLKRRLARVVFNTLKNNPSTATATGLAAAA
jgi:transposase